MKKLVVFSLLAYYSPSTAAVIEGAKVEQTGTGTYSIQFQTQPEAFPVEVYASSESGLFGSRELVTNVAKPADIPVVIKLPAASGRVYFHLKPKSGAERTVSIRRLPLEGAPNFRDLGGYRTTDGRYVRWGILYRAGQLAGLTEADYRYLSGLGLRLVCDFRIDAERQRSPTNWVGGNPPELLPASVDTISYARPGIDIREHMRNVYNRMPFDAAAEFGTILHRFVRGDLPALVHCTAGKDRTGFFSALLLTALGVPFETVREDFLLTNKYLVPEEKIPEMARQLQARQKLDSPPDAETVRAANGVDPENLALAFRVIDEKYGSFAGYLRDGLKISAEEIKALQDRLLER
jgi:protein-tyrosine phosphatase